MKKILLAAVVSLVCNASFAQDKNEIIQGNGKVVTRDVAISSFDALKASGLFELELSQGSTESVKIEADENLQDYFTVKKEGSKLVINTDKLKNRNSGKLKLKVYVTFKQLQTLDVSTIGNVKSAGSLSLNDLKLSTNSVGHVDLKLTANKILLNNQGVGNVTLSGKAQNAVFRHEGVGSLEAGNFVVQTVDIKNTGVGSAEVNAAKELKVEDSYMGKIKNRGAALMKN
ncbi:MAG TPA: head GIN domain-containing protein [Segetibacter sp.]|jgi:hypothetical protein